MSLVGKSQQFLVTTAVAKGNQFVFLTMAIDGENAIYLLLSVTVLGKESTCQMSILHLHLSTHNPHFREKRLHPIVDAGTHDKHLGLFCLRLFHHFNALGPEQVLTIKGEQAP